MKYESFDPYAIKHQSIIELYNSKTPKLLRVRTKVTIALLAFIAWCMVLIESGVRYFMLPYVDFDPKKPMFYVMCALISAVSIAIFKPYRFFTKKSYYGKITHFTNTSRSISGLTPREKTWTILSGRKSQAYCLTLATPDEKTKTVYIPQSDYAKQIYTAGSYVSVICGVKIPVPMDKSKIPSDKCICTYCGSLESSGHMRCSVCRETLWYK